MNTFRELWRKLAKSKNYREEFVASQVKRGIPFQIRALMKKKHLSQEELALRANLSQGVISRAANPNYGNLTLNTIIRTAAGFDVAFVGRFVPFSELGKWFTNLSEQEIGAIPTFEEEDERMQRKSPAREEVEDSLVDKLRGTDRFTATRQIELGRDPGGLGRAAVMEFPRPELHKQLHSEPRQQQAAL